MHYFLPLIVAIWGVVIKMYQTITGIVGLQVMRELREVKSKPPGKGRGVINSLPSLGLQVIRTKVSISLQYEKPVIQSSPLAISVPPTSRQHALLTTEVVKRNDWCSGFRNQSLGNVEYHRPATVQWSLHMSSVRECS